MPMWKSRSTATSSDGDGQHRRAQDHDEAGGVVRPDEQRQAEPGHPRRAHAVDGDDEVEAGEDRREAGDEDAQAVAIT